MKHESITVAVIQQTGDDNKSWCLQQTIAHIKKAAADGAELVLLQELHNGLYFCQTQNTAIFDQAEPIPGPTSNALCALAKELNIVIVASLFEQRAPGLYHNTAIVIERDGQIAGRYRKMHIPHDPGYCEKYYFAPGDLGFQPISTSVGKLGVLVCWDQWYPEAARLMALNGAELLLYPTAIGWISADKDADERTRQLDAWMTIQRAHAVANHLPVLVANRVGFEANPDSPDVGIEFWGNSFIAGPQGEIIQRASANKSEILISRIDKTKTQALRRQWPFLRDRRIDAYQGLLERYSA
jgi:N-carbamoylputrescine amidase